MSHSAGTRLAVAGSMEPRNRRWTIDDRPWTTRQPPAIVVGRTAAACVHPVAAWHVLPASWRIVVLTVYTVTSYLTVLTILVTLNP